MERLTAVLAIATLTALSSPALSQALTQQDAIKMMASESAECASFYIHEMWCPAGPIGSASQQEEIKSAQLLFGTAISFAHAFGIAAGYSMDEVRAKMFSIGRFDGQGNPVCSDAADLYLKYKSKCDLIIRRPYERFNLLKTLGN
jgi:hypothetical protein